MNYLAEGDYEGDTTRIPYEGAWVDLSFAEPDKPYFFYNYTPAYIVEEESVDEVIDFQSAVHLVEEELSGFSRLKVCEIRVEYMIYAEKSENENDNKEKEGAIFHTKPVYSFLIEFGEVDDAVETLGIFEDEEYVYVNVDMTDGTVITNFEERNFHD